MVVYNLYSHRCIIDSAELWWSMAVKEHTFKHICLIIWCISNIFFYFVRDSLWSYTWFHPSPDGLGLAVDTSLQGVAVHFKWQWTGKNLIFPLKFGLLVSLFLRNKHARFHWDIFLTDPMIKIWFFFKLSLAVAKKTLVLQCSVHLKNCPQHI